MSAAKKSADGENPPPRAALPKKATPPKAASKVKSTPKARESVARISATVKPVSHDQHPGHDVHPRGHKPDEEIRILAHLYQPWANVNSNGSGVYALAHWAKFLEERGVAAVDDAVTASAGFLRGLTHR